MLVRVIFKKLNKIIPFYLDRSKQKIQMGKRYNKQCPWREKVAGILINDTNIDKVLVQ